MENGGENMYKLTEKENLLRLLETGYPEYLPEYDFYGWGTGTSMFRDRKSPDGYMVDEFGVEMTTSEASMGGFMPVPGRIFLKDIRKWRDVVKLPDLSGVDWERQAEKDMKGKDWVTKPVIVHNLGYFMLLMNMMGFVDGLCAMEEEPEEVYALFDYVSGYFLEKEKALLKYYHGDIYELADDTAAMQFPFISRETYQKLVKPFAKREADLALNAGLKLLDRAGAECISCSHNYFFPLLLKAVCKLTNGGRFTNTVNTHKQNHSDTIWIHIKFIVLLTTKQVCQFLGQHRLKLSCIFNSPFFHFFTQVFN